MAPMVSNRAIMLRAMNPRTLFFPVDDVEAGDKRFHSLGGTAKTEENASQHPEAESSSGILAQPFKLVLEKLHTLRRQNSGKSGCLLLHLAGIGDDGVCCYQRSDGRKNGKQSVKGHSGGDDGKVVLGEFLLDL